MKYKIYTKVNYADTIRDDDDIHYKTLALKNDLSAAIAVALSYIKTNFFHKNTPLVFNTGADISWLYRAYDACSYGETIIIQQLNPTAY